MSINISKLVAVVQEYRLQNIRVDTSGNVFIDYVLLEVGDGNPKIIREGSANIVTDAGLTILADFKKWVAEKEIEDLAVLQSEGKTVEKVVE